MAKFEFAFDSCFVLLCSQKFKLEWMGDDLSGHAGFPCEKGYGALGVNHKDLFGREACLLPALAWKTECALRLVAFGVNLEDLLLPREAVLLSASA